MNWYAGNCVSDNHDPLAEIRSTFFVECEELLENLQDGLQELGDGGNDPETVNIIFRAVHSIKGGAGAFGFQELVDFAHSFETVLDLVRSGELDVPLDTLDLFFSASDILSDLLRAAQTGEIINPEARNRVLNGLKELSGGDDDTLEEHYDFQPMVLSLDLPEIEAENTNPSTGFLIRFRPSFDLYATGNEPLFMLRALEKIGPIEVSLDSSYVPPLIDWDDERANVEWVVSIQTDAEKAEIEGIFDFVNDVCDLSIEPLEPTGIDAECADQSPLDKTPIPATIRPPVSIGANPKAAADPRPEKKATPKSVEEQSTIRVGLKKIDALMNLVGELVINQAMLSQSLANAEIISSSNINQSLDELARLSRDLQDSVMSIRAQPVKSLFQRMNRIVRESSADLGKTIKFKTIGEETEVDKTVIERLADRLTHMLRNAVDHGLERNDHREAVGKTTAGNVTLSAAHQSGRVIIEVQDDGAMRCGLNIGC